MQISRMKLDIPIKRKTEKEKCIVCKGDVSNFFARNHDNICEKCWYKINKENSK